MATTAKRQRSNSVSDVHAQLDQFTEAALYCVEIVRSLVGESSRGWRPVKRPFISGAITWLPHEWNTIDAMRTLKQRVDAGTSLIWQLTEHLGRLPSGLNQPVEARFNLADSAIASYWHAKIEDLATDCAHTFALSYGRMVYEYVDGEICRNAFAQSATPTANQSRDEFSPPPGFMRRFERSIAPSIPRVSNWTALHSRIRNEYRAMIGAVPKNEKQSGTPRGRRKADYRTQASEEQLAKKWQQAKEAGTYKPDFAADNHLTVLDLNRLLDRVRARSRPAE